MYQKKAFKSHHRNGLQPILVIPYFRVDSVQKETVMSRILPSATPSELYGIPFRGRDSRRNGAGNPCMTRQCSVRFYVNGVGRSAAEFLLMESLPKRAFSILARYTYTDAISEVKKEIRSYATPDGRYVFHGK